MLLPNMRAVTNRERRGRDSPSNCLSGEPAVLHCSPSGLPPLTVKTKEASLGSLFYKQPHSCKRGIVVSSVPSNSRLNISKHRSILHSITPAKHSSLLPPEHYHLGLRPTDTFMLLNGLKTGISNPNFVEHHWKNKETNAAGT